MPTRKIANPVPRWPSDGQMICKHPEHNPPSMVVLEPGLYEHTCPKCYKLTVFRVPERSER